MSSKPEHIDVKSHKALVKSLDYMVSHGQIYEVVVNGFDNDVHLKAVDEIPEEYHERWEDSDE